MKHTYTLTITFNEELPREQVRVALSDLLHANLMDLQNTGEWETRHGVSGASSEARIVTRGTLGELEARGGSMRTFAKGASSGPAIAEKNGTVPARVVNEGESFIVPGPWSYQQTVITRAMLRSLLCAGFTLRAQGRTRTKDINVATGDLAQRPGGPKILDVYDVQGIHLGKVEMNYGHLERNPIESWTICLYDHIYKALEMPVG